MWPSPYALQTIVCNSRQKPGDKRARIPASNSARAPLFYQPESVPAPGGARRMADVVSKKVALSVADGSSMEAFVARPAGPGPFPGLLLFQEAFGVNFHIRDVAHRFARERLVVIAPELFHRTAPAGLEIPYDDFPQAAPHLKALTPEAIKLDARAAYDWLTSQPNVRRERIACVGFCMGGRVSFLANASLPLQAAVSFYGGGI